MYKIEYEINLNEKGRPCIGLLKNHENKPEDKFLVIELARYIVQEVYGRKISEFDKKTATMIDVTIRLLGQLGDEMAELLWNSMKTAGDATFIMGQNFHVICNTIEERDKIDEKGILYFDKLYVRQEGLKVLVKEDKWKIYELKGGTSNDNWIEMG